MTSGIQLRDYQRDAAAAVMGTFQSGQRRTLIVFGHLVRDVVDREGRALVLAHTECRHDRA